MPNILEIRCIVENNKSRISEKQLKAILQIISDNWFFVVYEWKNYFGLEDVKFYC